jgi:hypothetical protein
MPMSVFFGDAVHGVLRSGTHTCFSSSVLMSYSTGTTLAPAACRRASMLTSLLSRHHRFNELDLRPGLTSIHFTYDAATMDCPSFAKSPGYKSTWRLDMTFAVAPQCTRGCYLRQYANDRPQVKRRFGYGLRVYGIRLKRHPACTGPRQSLRP